MTLAAELVVWSVVAHLVADWPLQSDWMAKNKSNLSHPAGYIHGLIHAGLIALVYLLIVPWWLAIPAGLLVGLAHWFIDLRILMLWWQQVYGFAQTGPVISQVKIWTDQVFHLVVLAIVSGLVSLVTGLLG